MDRELPPFLILFGSQLMRDAISRKKCLQKCKRLIYYSIFVNMKLHNIFNYLL